jgi:hypothetical protein
MATALHRRRESLDLPIMVSQVRGVGEIGSAEVVLGRLDEEGPVARLRQPPSIWELLERQGGIVSSWWEGHQVRSQEIGAGLRAMQAMLVPASLYFLFVVPGALLVSGVVVPLIFLSGGSGAAKWILFALLTRLPSASSASTDMSCGDCDGRSSPTSGSSQAGGFRLG